MLGRHFVSEMDRFQREMDRMFYGFGPVAAPSLQASRGTYRVNETDEGYQVRVVVPGLDADTLDISVLGRQLTLKAGPSSVEQDDDLVWHRRERAGHQLEKTLTLPRDIDSERVDAEYRDGILLVNLPKTAAAVPKRIEVSCKA